MFQRRTRRFRRRPNDRAGFSHGNGNAQGRLRPHSFSNEQTRNKFRPSLSAEKLFEKYSTLAKEAMTTGDKTLSENYLQHADHFMRIIEDKNRNQNKFNVVNKSIENKKNLLNNVEINEDNELKNKDNELKNKDNELKNKD